MIQVLIALLVIVVVARLILKVIALNPCCSLLAWC